MNSRCATGYKTSNTTTLNLKLIGGREMFMYTSSARITSVLVIRFGCRTATSCKWPPTATDGLCAMQSVRRNRKIGHERHSFRRVKPCQNHLLH